MLEPPPLFDWASLLSQIAQIESLPNGSEVPAFLDPHRIWRINRFCRENSRSADWARSRNAVAEMAREFALSPMRAARLYIEIQKLASGFAFHRSLERFAKAPEATTMLEHVVKSLDMVAQFSRELLDKDAHPKPQIAGNRLETALHLWAKEKLAAGLANRTDALIELEALGFSYQSYSNELGHMEDFGSTMVLRNWLRMNVLMNDLVSTTIKKYRDGNPPDAENNLAWLGGESAVRKLVGHDLPALYTRLTFKPFGISKGIANVAQNTTGVKWVNMALIAIGWKQYKPSTIEDYWDQTKK